MNEEDESEAQHDEYLENDFVMQILILVFSTFSFFVNCIFLLFLDKQNTSRRTKNIIGSYVLGSILKAATAASDAGRHVAIGTRTVTATPLSCLFQSPYLIMLIFTSTYAALAQLIVAVHSLVSAVWVHTPYSTREKINDNLFLGSVGIGLLDVVVGVTLTIFRKQVDVPSNCGFNHVMPTEYAIFHWVAVTIISYSSILIYVSAFFILRVNWSARKRIHNSRVLHILRHEVESVNRLSPIYILSITQDILPVPWLVLMGLGRITFDSRNYYGVLISVQLCWFPIIYLLCLKGDYLISLFKNFRAGVANSVQLSVISFPFFTS